jgi:beta-N-acetylhexosaminidase
MTLEQRVGQLFIWTYPGTELTGRGKRWLERYQPGSLIVFSRNIRSRDQIAKFNSDLQNLAKSKFRAPLFLMVDQEGGTVTRLKSPVPLPSALAVGQLNDSEFTKKYGSVVADLLKELGFNVNLAPVLDISNPEKDSFIGSRSFGNDPEKVSQIAGAFAEGLSSGGVMPTAKHFPGHGGVVQDSHRAIPKKLSTTEELQDKDYVPFEEFAQSEFPRAIMIGHLSVPHIDPSGVPATYSSIVIGEHLRGKLKYSGLVITDDLEMNGASIDAHVSERAIKAFLAGNDMLMFAGTLRHQRLAFQAMLAAVKSKRVPEARLKESVLRVLNAKNEMQLGPFVYNAAKATASLEEAEKMARQVLKKNIRSAMHSTHANWPSVKRQTRVLVASSDRRVGNSFQKNFKGHGEFYGLSPATIKGVESEILKSRYAFAVFYVSGIQTARYLNRLNPEARAKVIVINTNHPGEIENRKSFLAVLNINSANPDCGSALAEFLSKDPRMREPTQVSRNKFAPSKI